MSAARVFCVVWLVSTAATTTALLKWGWRGDWPAVTEGSAWAAVLLAVSVASVATIVPVGIVLGLAAGAMNRKQKVKAAKRRSRAIDS